MATNQETLVRRYFEVIWNGHDLDRCSDFVADDFVGHVGATITIRGTAGVRAAFLAAAVSAARGPRTETYRIDDMFSAGGRVITRLSMPEVPGYDGTARRESYAGDPNVSLADEDRLMVIVIHRIRDGKIAEEWRVQEGSRSTQQQLMRVRQRVDEILRLIEAGRGHEAVEADRARKREWRRRIDEVKRRRAAGDDQKPS